MTVLEWELSPALVKKEKKRKTQEIPSPDAHTALYTISISHFG
jgi:hypothetical protein